MKKKLLVIFSLVLLTSCASRLVGIALKKSGVTDKKATLKKLEYKDKDILYLGMTHVGQEEFYADVKHKIDSLTKLGYFNFHESLLLKTEDRVIKEKDSIYYLKYRKLLTVDPLVKYTNSKPFSDYVDRFNLVDQPDNFDLGLSKSNSKPVDIPINEHIKAYEKERGEIVLTECDYETKLGDNSYDCEKPEFTEMKYFVNEILLKKRNRHIYENIKKTDKEKILIIYGKKHFDGLKALLDESD